MKVLLVSQHFELRGGSDVMVHHIRSMLEKAGHEVHLFAARTEEQADDGVHPSGAHFEKPGAGGLHKFFFNRDARKRLDTLLDREHFDVAHLHIHYGTLTSSIIEPLRRRRIPTVQHLHEYRSFCTISIARRDGETCTSCTVGNYLPGIVHRCNRGSLMRSAITCAEMYVADSLGAKSWPQRFLAVSNFQRDMLVRQGMPVDRTFTLHNPVDDIFFTVPDTSVPLGVLFFGRLEDYKGVFDVVSLARRLPEVPFILAGDGSQFERLRKIADEESLQNLKILGSQNRDQILRLLEKSMLAIVPSRWHETFGLTAVEAMASGTPVLVTDMGGLPEVIADGSTGKKVVVGDIAGMERFIRDLQNDPSNALTMGARGRERARTNFSQMAYLPNLLQHYEGAIEAVKAVRDR